ncbi:uncharacterized protein HD556DRAFT_594542 [Suillus plorans]|uniref:Uncharacterized protein n=1 Tax=Suillus plorans TaxID=116603 RepID=A0A9P7DUM1_9AGAM|nr:uncharacterized protein HD556DRAFT_594542 [Suillus plorans]KAG1803596.1 hypothetical protein HD556DRAFT_594542 [Suillus plorans]
MYVFNSIQCCIYKPRVNRFLDRNQVAPRQGPWNSKPTSRTPAPRTPNGGPNASRQPRKFTMKLSKPPKKPTTERELSTRSSITSIRRSASVGASQPITRNNSPTNGLATRRSVRNALSQEEIEDLPNTVLNYQTAEDYLTKKSLCLSGEPYTLTHLISILFQITQISSSIPLPVITAIRAVAFIMKKHEASELAKEVAQQITEAITPNIVDNVIAAIAPQVAKVLTASDLLETTLGQVEHIRSSLVREREEKEQNFATAVERIEEMAGNLYGVVEECQNKLTPLPPLLESTKEKIDSLTTQFSDKTASLPSSSLPQRTYSSVVAAHIPPSADRAVGRAAIRARIYIFYSTVTTPPGPQRQRILSLYFELSLVE